MIVQVAVHLPVAGLYDYAVPTPMQSVVAVGSRVQVRFGNRHVTGVVVALGAAASAAPTGGADSTALAVARKLSPIEAVIEPELQLDADMVQLALWVAEYYEAPPGEALRAAVPAGGTGEEATAVELTENGRLAFANSALPRKQVDLLATLEKPRRTNSFSAAEKRTLRELLAVGLVAHVAPAVATKTKVATERVVRLIAAADVSSVPARAKAKHELLAMLTTSWRPVADLWAHGASKSALRELIAAGLIEATSAPKTLQALAAGGLPAAVLPPTLTAEQQAAQHAIGVASTTGFAAFLLFGITGSGKTEVYLHAIADVLAAGKTALVLVPEISLTPQLASRFRARFGDQVAVLHSGLTQRDRHNEWQRLRLGKAQIAVGARSAVFAPLRNLGIIIVDEEHDSSFKQEEGVRYHARDVALVRAKRQGAVCVLGSATPSLESYAQCEAGTMRLLRLTQRPTAQPLPTVTVVDLKVHQPDGDTMISGVLRAAMEACLARQEQCVLFLNRRGYATFVNCMACGYAFRCPSCSVSMTYHQNRDLLVCHYCGNEHRVPKACPACKVEQSIKRHGLGTEKVAEGLQAMFPTARIARMDRDTTSGQALGAMLVQMQNRTIDILVGTQMVTKGHDFPGVTLVGVLCADTGLGLPDFRAAERTYSLLSQVAGRAGRGDAPGHVMIQTYRPSALAITAAASHDYVGFFRGELALRTELRYPPAGRLIALRIDGPEPAPVVETAKRLAAMAVASAGKAGNVEVLGPSAAPLERLRGRVRWQIWLRGTERATVRSIARAAAAMALPNGVRLVVDVDPVSTL